jgi:hypothetical protein
LTKSVSLTATGTNQATALALTSNINVISTAAAGTGVALPSLDLSFVTNQGANPIIAYPGVTGGNLNEGATGAGITVQTNTTAMFIRPAALTWESVP